MQNHELNENDYPIYYTWICEQCGDQRIGVIHPDYCTECPNEQDWIKEE